MVDRLLGRCDWCADQWRIGAWKHETRNHCSEIGAMFYVLTVCTYLPKVRLESVLDGVCLEKRLFGGANSPQAEAWRKTDRMND